jgi:hypothetical protein
MMEGAEPLAKRFRDGAGAGAFDTTAGAGAFFDQNMPTYLGHDVRISNVFIVPNSAAGSMLTPVGPNLLIGSCWQE